MTLKFYDKNEFTIDGGEWKSAPFGFGKTLKIGSYNPVYQEVIVNGKNSLTLPNAKQNGLNYVKLFGACEKDFTPTSMDYSTVYSMAHSTFDANKFTVVGSPTITDGVASGFSGSNYLTVDITNFFNNNYNFEINTKIKYTSNTTEEQLIWYIDWIFKCRVYMVNNKHSLQFFMPYGANYVNLSCNLEDYNFVDGDDLYIKCISENASSRKLMISKDGVTWQTFTNTYTTDKNLTSYTTLKIGQSASTIYWLTSIDLKQLSIKVDGEPVFSGNQTGSDTYTIGSSSVTIPYTLSSTGEKIVDNAYLTNVQSVAENLEKTPYIVLNNSNSTATDYRAKIICNNGTLKVNGQGQIYADGTIETVIDELGNTATAENLLAVGTYQDVQEVLTGTITRKCEAVYYDGTQTISSPYISSTGGLDIGAIIVYPKTTSTTDTVTSQILNTNIGSNTLRISQSSTDDLSLEVSYMAGVTVTIEQIEAVNLDNEVEVVIS